MEDHTSCLISKLNVNLCINLQENNISLCYKPVVQALPHSFPIALSSRPAFASTHLLIQPDIEVCDTL